MRKITKNVQYKQAFSIKSDVNVFFFSDNLPKPLKKLNFGKLLVWITCQNRYFFVILASYPNKKVMNRLIGRHKEQAKLQTCMNSERSEFVVVYQGLLHLILL